MATDPPPQAEIEELRVQVETKMLADMNEAAGTDVMKPREFGATWLHVAAANGFIEVLQLLLDK